MPKVEEVLREEGVEGVGGFRMAMGALAGPRGRGKVQQSCTHELGRGKVQQAGRQAGRQGGAGSTASRCMAGEGNKGGMNGFSMGPG